MSATKRSEKPYEVLKVQRIAVSRSDAAELVGLSDMELKRAIDNDEIRAKYRGRKCLVDVADLKAWFDALPSQPPKRTA